MVSAVTIGVTIILLCAAAGLLYLLFRPKPATLQYKLVSVGSSIITPEGWWVGCSSGTGPEQIDKDKKTIIMFPGNSFTTGGIQYTCSSF